MPKEDHGVLIISVVAIVSFVSCFLCTICHRKRKRQHRRQLQRNANYDSTTSATGELCQEKFCYLLFNFTINKIFSIALSSSRRNLQSSLPGSIHGLSEDFIPPAPPAPASLPPHLCGGLMDDDFDGNNRCILDDGDDDDIDNDDDECQVHLHDDMNPLDVTLNDDPFVSISTNINNNMNNSNLVNHYMNINSAMNPNPPTANDYYQNVLQIQTGENV